MGSVRGISDEFKEENSPQGLECPVCYEYFKPPIRQCIVGHSLCKKCRPQLQNCPLCKSSFSEVRNYSLEDVVTTITLPCRYRDLGCSKLLKLCDKEDHENGNCQMKPYFCVGCKHCVCADEFENHYATCLGPHFFNNGCLDPVNEKSASGGTLIWKCEVDFGVLKKSTVVFNRINSHGDFVSLYMRGKHFWYIWYGLVNCKAYANKYFFGVELICGKRIESSLFGHVQSMHMSCKEVIQNNLCFSVSRNRVRAIRNRKKLFVCGTIIATK